MARNRQIIRTWTIVRALSGSWRSIGALARELEVHPRTVRRDLESLEAAGFPLTVDEDRRWHLLNRKEVA